MGDKNRNNKIVPLRESIDYPSARLVDIKKSIDSPSAREERSIDSPSARKNPGNSGQGKK